MSEPFIAEIRIFAGDFAPRGWAFCDGQTLQIDKNTVLFSLIGTIYGGDGYSTFALPNLQGRAPMHPGQGPGLTPRRLGEEVGEKTITLTEAQMPAHNHMLRNAATVGRNNIDVKPTENFSFAESIDDNIYQTQSIELVPMSHRMLSSTGGSKSHRNVQPFLALNFIIALTGIYPARE